jgi:hypothetical protein
MDLICIPNHFIEKTTDPGLEKINGYEIYLLKFNEKILKIVSNVNLHNMIQNFIKSSSDIFVITK